MHPESYSLMNDVVQRLMTAKELSRGQSVLDVGSYDVNGSYRALFEGYGLSYTGLDATPGPNVDIVKDIYDLRGIENRFHLVASGQALEHMEFPLLATISMKAAVRTGGWIVLIAPAEWPLHRHPVDCWRILPDGMQFLLTGFQYVEAFTIGRDTVGVGKKPRDYRERWEIIDRLKAHQD
jgi:hypothetical protein